MAKMNKNQPFMKNLNRLQLNIWISMRNRGNCNRDGLFNQSAD